MNNPLSKLVSWQVQTSQLDGWTSYHIAAGAFLCKIFQWLDWSDFWCVAWEVFEWFVEGDEETYGTKKAWAYNSASDLLVETAMAWWMVL